MLERLTVLSLLPQKGDIVTLRTVNEYIGKVGLTEEEIEKHKIVQQPDGQVKWKSNDMTTDIIDIEFGDTAKGIISKELKALEERKELTFQYMSLYEKFVEGKGG
jgi:hypothetical protein